MEKIEIKFYPIWECLPPANSDGFLVYYRFKNLTEYCEDEIIHASLAHMDNNRKICINNIFNYEVINDIDHKSQIRIIGWSTFSDDFFENYVI